MNALTARLPTLGSAASRMRNGLFVAKSLATAAPEMRATATSVRSFWGRACVRRAPAVYDSVFMADPLFSPAWRPVSPFMRVVMENLQNDMKLLREEFWTDFDKLRRSVDKGNVFGLRARVSETESQFKLTADLPGVPRENVKVTVTSEGALEVRAVRTEAPTAVPVAGDKAVNAETLEVKFRSMFKLPPEVDREGIKASVKDGVLEITLPKSATPPVSTKHIEVTTA